MSSGPIELARPIPMLTRPRPAIRRPELLAHGRLLIALVLGVGGLFTACQESGVDPTDGPERTRFERLGPEPTSSAPVEAVARRYRKLSPSPDAPWQVEGARARVVPLGESSGAEGTYTLLLSRSDNPTIVIPGPFDPSAFNNVTLKAVLGKSSRINLQFVRDDGTVTVGHRVRPGARGKPGIVPIDSPSIGRLKGEIRELRVTFIGKPGYARIDWIDLLWRPSVFFFPDPAGGAELIELAGDLRRAVGVSTGRPVEVRFEAPAHGALCFAYGLPPHCTREKPAPVLQLELTGAGDEVVSYSYPLDSGSVARWQTVRLPLATSRGEIVNARWRIVGGGEAACALAEVGVLTEGAAPRRVLLITSDTHRSDHLGAARRGVAVRTPVLDALAERGILFEDCFSSTNITNPSHVALMTATHPRDTGILQNNQRMAEAAPTLAEAFQRAGFVTYSSVSAQHLGDAISGLGQGFDRMSVPTLGRYRDGGEAIDVIAEWVREADGLPLFIWLHLFDAHAPYQPPPELGREYYPDEERAFDPTLPAPEGIAAELYEGPFPGLKDLEYPRAMYRGEITYLDAELQRLFEMPGMQPAIIGFTADHGECLGEHGIYYSHADLYPDTLHVPMIISAPDGPRGVRCSLPVRQTDLGRTLLDLSGSAGVEFLGSNLLSVAESGAESGEPRFAIASNGGTASVTAAGWHLMLQLSSKGGPHRQVEKARHTVELYYLPKDLECVHDLLDGEAARARELRRSLIDWLSRAEDRGWGREFIDDPAILRGLEALGYAGGVEAAPATLEFIDPACSCEWCSRFE